MTTPLYDVTISDGTRSEVRRDLDPYERNRAVDFAWRHGLAYYVRPAESLSVGNGRYR